jgi:hypothetical protein
MRRGAGPWIAAAVALVVGTVIWWNVDHYVCRIPKIPDVVLVVQTFRSEIQFVADDPKSDATKLQAALQRIDTEQEKWLNYSTEEDIRAFQTRLRTRLDELQRK